MKKIIFVVIWSLSSLSFAGPFVSGGIGDNSLYVTCDGSVQKRPVHLEIYGTASPVLKQAYLYFTKLKKDSPSATLNCQKSPEAYLHCSEIAPRQGRLQLDILRDKANGSISATVKTTSDNRESVDNLQCVLKKEIR